MKVLKVIEQAIIYIESHLGEKITVEGVAEEVGYSYCHLTRLFDATLGESLGNYIKKRRLADAAKRLLYTKERVIDIALNSGFGSPEAFSRAFKTVYQVSPVLYRKNRLDLVISEKKRLEPELLCHIATGITVKPQIVETEEIRVVGIRGETTLNDNAIPSLWKEFSKIVENIPNKMSPERHFGVTECSDQTLCTMSGDVVFSEMIGAEVEHFSALDNHWVEKTISGGKYAIFTHTGSLAMLHKTYDYIWGTWFLVTKEKLDSREDFELYDNRFLGYDHPESQIDIYIPVK